MTDNEYIEPQDHASVEAAFSTKLKHLIFGTTKPDAYTLSTFLINLIIWFIFTLWQVLSLIAIQSRELIWQKKGISVEAIINERGETLGFSHGMFIEDLYTAFSIGLICWLVFFFGLIQLYRKKPRFIYFTIVPLVFFLGLQIFYLNFTYFIEDTTTFDKIALLIAFVSLFLHYFLLRNERVNGTINFFGIDRDEVTSEAE